MVPESFVSAVHQGKNDWWRYVLGILTLMFAVIVPGSLVTGMAIIAVLLVRGQMDGLFGASRSESLMLALLRERGTYVVRGLPDRVAAVDEQIRLRGGTPPKLAK